MVFGDVLDKTDQKLLAALVANARAPLSQLAKKANISKQSCHYRLKRLQEECIITSYRAKIDSSLLGNSSYCLYLNLIDINEQQEQELITKLVAKDYVRWLVTSIGRWDLMVAFNAKNNNDFSGKLKELLKHADNKVQAYETAIILSTNNLWLADRAAIGKQLNESSEGASVTIDEKDLKILGILEQDCRTEATRIAPIVALTPEGVSYRIKQLQKQGVIHSYAAAVNKERLGLTWYQVQFLLKNIDDQHERYLVSQLKMIEGVDYIVRMIGKWNFEVDMYCESIAQFRNNLQRIRSLLAGNIREYDVNIILSKHKTRTLTIT